MPGALSATRVLYAAIRGEKKPKWLYCRLPVGHVPLREAAARVDVELSNRDNDLTLSLEVWQQPPYKSRHRLIFTCQVRATPSTSVDGQPNGDSCR